VHSFLRELMSDLQSITCHMGSCSVTCHLRRYGTQFFCSGAMKGWADIGAGYIRGSSQKFPASTYHK